MLWWPPLHGHIELDHRRTLVLVRHAYKLGNVRADDSGSGTDTRYKCAPQVHHHAGRGTHMLAEHTTLV